MGHGVRGYTLDSPQDGIPAFMVLTTFHWMVSLTVKVGVIIVLISGLQGGLDEIIHIMNLVQCLAAEKVPSGHELLLLLTPGMIVGPQASGALKFFSAALIPLIITSLMIVSSVFVYPVFVYSRHFTNNEYMNECYFISEPPFPHLQNGVINSPYLTGLI